MRAKAFAYPGVEPAEGTNVRDAPLWLLYNEERLKDGASTVTLTQYLGSSRFWFGSLQNWQSEFLSIGAMVLLSIWLREVNSTESKAVETPHWEIEE